MVAPMSRPMELIGNALQWFQNQPDLRALGKGVGMAYDLGQNAPMNTSYNIPAYTYEEDKQHGGSSSGPAGNGAGTPSGY